MSGETFVGLDVHAESITATILRPGSEQPEVIKLASDPTKVRRFFRRLLVEAAWNNRHNAGAALILNRRRQGQPPEIVAIALKAQHRLTKKFLRLDQRKHRHVAITAVARELCGFVWAILMAVPRTEH